MGVDGTVVMSQEFMADLGAIFEARLPVRWISDASGAEIPWLMLSIVGWFTGLMDRQAMLNSWLENERAVTKSLPNPAKSPYAFNALDGSNDFQGLGQCSRESLPKGDDLSKVWMHERDRVSKDRLTTRQDMPRFFDTLKHACWTGRSRSRRWDRKSRADNLCRHCGIN